MKRHLLAGSLAVVLLADLGLGLAAPRKPAPVTGSYIAEARTPEPVTQAVGLNRSWCDPMLDSAKHERLFRIPFAGRLTVQLTGFVGDWALGVFDPGGEPYAVSDNFYTTGEPVDRPEEVTILLRKPGTLVVLRACNLIGGPTARVEYAHRPL